MPPLHQDRVPPESRTRRRGPPTGRAARRRRTAFTLIEVLIVLVLVAVLSAVMIPRFASPTKDAMQSALEHDLKALRTQIEIYRIHHREQYPKIEANDLPQLTGATDVRGQIGAPGKDFPFGPYLAQGVPPNPFDSSSKVSPVAVSGQRPKGVVGKLGGWQYDEKTGAVWPNHREYYGQASAVEGPETVEALVP